ncbi:MAG TPA: hypothetical protein VEB86_02355 [Chryseosolibacter sp.]|nr:hypothetical protein [Chryseosolibacter sp.]
MNETNSLKYYVAKYLFPGLAVLQFLIVAIILGRHGLTISTFFTGLIFFLLGVGFLVMFYVINDRIRRVAIGKHKIVVIERNRNLRFSWPEVKSVKVVPFVNMCRLKIKGKRSIYFFPSENVFPSFGLTKEIHLKKKRLLR